MPATSYQRRRVCGCRTAVVTRARPSDTRPPGAGVLDVRALGRVAAGVVWSVAVVGVLACDRDTPAPPRPTPPAVTPPAPPPPLPAPPAPVVAVGWDAEAGVALVVPGPADDALLVTPGAPDSVGADTARAARSAALPASVMLLGTTGFVGEARAVAADDGDGAPVGPRARRCARWPRVRLGPAGGADAVPPWTVGLVTPRDAEPPSALPLEPLGAHPGADSAALAAALTRLAAGLPEAAGVRPAVRAALRGVPFRVKRVRAFTPDTATQAVVATLTRTVNQEAAPAADVLLLVAERPAGGGADAWRVAFAERATGPEEELPATEALAAVRLGRGGGAHAALVTAREGDDGVRYGLLAREAPGEWRPRWTSARSGGAGCGR